MQALAPIKKEDRLKIKDWAEADRPREKLIAKGPQALTDSELLAVIIPGTAKHNAIEQGRIILEKHDNDLQALGRSTARDLAKLKIEGFGIAKAAVVVAALELGRRQQATIAAKRPDFKDSHVAAEFLRAKLAHYSYEVFGVLYLDQSGRMKLFDIPSMGGISATYVDPRLIFKRALQEEAVSIIVSHNHPSGNLQPSRADEVLTAKIQEGAKYLDIRFLDHIIVSNRGYFSFANEGLLS